MPPFYGFLVCKKKFHCLLRRSFSIGRFAKFKDPRTLIKYTFILGIVFSLTIVGLIFADLISKTEDVGYAPTQPIPFKHSIHAGENKIECLYCHQNVDKSRHATVPAMNVCMGCHTHVATDRPNVQILTELYNKGESSHWVKIHDLPEHVFFPHNRHVAAGVKCQICHGPIQEMDKVKQENEFTMGFCLRCHRKNDFVNEKQGVGRPNYDTQRAAKFLLGDKSVYKDNSEAKPLAIHPVTHMNANTTCSTCHQ